MVDAAVMLDVIHTNTNMPSMMITVWVADAIKEGRCIPATARGDQTSNP